MDVKLSKKISLKAVFSSFYFLTYFLAKVSYRDNDLFIFLACDSTKCKR